jgi:ribosome maturation factor RimP
MGAAAPVFFERNHMAADVYDKEKTLLREITPKVEGAIPGVEVLALELSGPERFTVYIDHPQRVDHALCERVTDVLRPYLLQYTVDVSSPGIERPLRTPAHFERVVGRRVALRTATDIEGRKKFKGEVVGTSSRSIRVAAAGDEYEIPYDAIVRGNLIEEGVR